MSPRIRVDTEGLKRSAAKVEQTAAKVDQTGDAVYQNTFFLKDYGGQLPAKKSALQARQEAKAIQGLLKDDAEQLRALAVAFEKADQETAGAYPLIPKPPSIVEIIRRRPNLLMQTSKCGVSFIAFHEDVDKNFYPLYEDPAGNCTVGIGHLVRMGPCTAADRATWGKGLSKEDALELLAEDVKKAEEIVKSAVTVPLTQAQFDALVSLAYNLGRIPEDVLEAVNAGNDDLAGELMEKYVYGSNGVLYGGLVKRRNHEHELFENGLYGNEFCDTPEGGLSNREKYP